METNTIYNENCLETVKRMPDGFLNSVVTSPPYFGLRDYGTDQQFGLEETPELFVQNLVTLFREIHRVLRDDGTVWLNLGDSYAGSGKGGQSTKKRSINWQPEYGHKGKNYGFKPKDLIGIPWRVAFALQADGWYLRQDIIWHKPNPMPESVTDRCTKSHEYIFLLTKSAKYWYDHDAIKEPVTQSTISRLMQPNLDSQAGSNRVPGKTNGRMKAVGVRPHGIVRNRKLSYDSKENQMRGKPDKEVESESQIELADTTRNKRSVWTVTTKPYKEAHFAVFPDDLIKPCILAGCPKGGIVYDPFGGSGTTAEVAIRAGRNWILSELNPEYVDIANTRLRPHMLQRCLAL